MDNNKRNPTSVRLNAKTRELILLLKEKLGISQADIIALAIKDLAKKEKVKSE